MANTEEPLEELKLEDVDDPIFTIKCGSYLWEIRSSLLADSSDFLRVACFGAFKEANENLLHLPDDDPTTIIRVLQWIHCEEYEADNTHWFNHDGVTADMHLPQFEDQTAWRQLLWEDRGRMFIETHAYVYVLADKLGLLHLKPLASESADEFHSLHYCPGQFVWYFERFPQKLTEDPDLQSHLVKLAMQCFPIEDGNLDDPYFKRLLDNNNKFVHFLCATLVSRVRQQAARMSRLEDVLDNIHVDVTAVLNE